jgi:putative phage-type endonuclease
MPFKIIDHEQGSIPWLRWRHDGIGGSDAPALMGENPWRSAKALFAEKSAPSRYGSARPAPAKPVIADLFAAAPPAAPPSPDRRYRSAASRGTALEPYARELYNRHIGGELVPSCLESIALPWQRVSLDGLCLKTRRVLEIKCGDKVYAHTETTGKVPGYYIGQLQHILAVSGFDAIDFWVWLPGKTPLLLTVPRDDAYIARMTAIEAEFWAGVTDARQISSANRP